MIRYQLRAEDREHENPWAPRDHCWHVARIGSEVALCSRRLGPVTSVRPIDEADCVAASERCEECWEFAVHGMLLSA